MGFQFKQELAELILAGKKTQTRRPVKEGEYLGRRYTEGLDISRDKPYYNAVFTANTHLKWIEDRVYAIQPGRGKKGVGFLKVVNIRCEDVREISYEDVRAEGFEDRRAFWHVWCTFYDFKARGDQIDYLRWERSQPLYSAYDWLQTRPVELYQAWAISFELVKAAEAVQS